MNFYYFGFLFVILSFVHGYHILLIDPASGFSRFFFIIYAIAQCFLEMSGLLLLNELLRKYTPRLFSSIFVALTAVLVLLHALDFPLIRLFDMSVWYSLGFVFQETFSNFLELLYASHISLKAWLIGGVSSVVLLFLSYKFFHLTEKMTFSLPLSLSMRTLLKAQCSMLVFLCLWDFGIARFTLGSSHGQYNKALPWKTTFFPPSQDCLHVYVPLKPPLKEAHAQHVVATRPLRCVHKPPIFLFVIESLRVDAITAQTAPFLNDFKNQNISISPSFASSNYTQGTWFSLFHSQHTFYWAHYQKTNWVSGSIPLQLLKEAGYKIGVYSTSGLSYYRMDELLFGEKTALLDSLYLFPPRDDVASWKSDQEAFTQLCSALPTLDEEVSQLFIVFIESTHFDYSWPDDQPPHFQPITEDINYLKAACFTSNLEAIKNRYRNAVFYIDSLFGQFCAALKQSGHWDDAVIVVTGDHGEEFFEYGHLFHASELNNYQTQVPIYYKFAATSQSSPHSSVSMTSHVDIFPTLLHYLSPETDYKDVLTGTSLFQEKTWPYVCVARYNAGRSPYEFFLHNGKEKLTVRFSDEESIFNCQQLRVLSIKDCNDIEIADVSAHLRSDFGQALNHLFRE